MFLLGQLAGLLLVVALFALPVLILALWTWERWLRVQRSRRPPRSAYDDAYVRALESIARRNGALAAERDIAELVEGG